MLPLVLGLWAAFLAVTMAIPFDLSLLAAISAAIGAGVPVATIAWILTYEAPAAADSGGESR